MTLDELRDRVGRGEIDTVVLALPDMQGRLVGKRMTAEHFLEIVDAGEAAACGYLLATDVEMTPVDGFASASWERGYGDLVLRPDSASLRPLPWQPRTALCLADAAGGDGRPIAVSPRQVLRAQVQRLAERGLEALGATELEFLLFRETYEEAWAKGYRGLTPANLYNVDYSILGTSRVEPLIGKIRSLMAGAELDVEGSKGECAPGQHEINFRHSTVLRAADDHVIYKEGAKEIASQEGRAISFMAKYDGREGNSCHIHLSLWRMSRDPLFAADDGAFRAFVGGQLACLRELTLLYAPNVNSYKRYVRGSFAPTTVAWGRDNRTCSLRVVGRGRALRVENRVPGADVNPYLALAAMLAAGMHGMDARLDLEPAIDGNAYASDKPRLPASLRDARELFERSEVARAAFGDEVVEHYVTAAQVELDAFAAAVTDWEHFRGFERL